MSDLTELRELFIFELKDLYDSERRMGEKLYDYKKLAKNSSLEKIIDDHIEETDEQISRLEGVAERLNFDTGGVECLAMKGIIEEGEAVTGQPENKTALKDAAIILALQKARHYHIASYGAAVDFAYEMGYSEEASLLRDNLRQEQEGDRLLSRFATEVINPAAK